jgi:hypothetical protein
MDMKTVLTYKGVVLKKNATYGNNYCEGPYAVYFTNGKHAPFKSLAEFKRVVNADSPEFGVMFLNNEGRWIGGVRQREFREFALKNQITDGLKFKKPEECELFSVIEEDGKKYVHVHGFIWEASGERDWKDREHGDGRTNEKDGFWVLTEYARYLIPIKEFIEKVKNPDYCFEVGTKYQQYDYDCTTKEMVEFMNTYFFDCEGGHGANARLPYAEVTVDTPCGDYVA